MNPLYEEDFPAWLDCQINLIREKKFEQLDTEHLLEEMEDLGSSNRDAIESHLANILLHLLKLKYQPDFETRSWHDSIFAAKDEISDKIKKYPCLWDFPSKCLERSYFRARKLASKQTGLVVEKFPIRCPWTMEEILGE